MKQFVFFTYIWNEYTMGTDQTNNSVSMNWSPTCAAVELLHMWPSPFTSVRGQLSRFIPLHTKKSYALQRGGGAPCEFGSSICQVMNCNMNYPLERIWSFCCHIICISSET